jgi:hypothetical protein
MVGLTLEWVQSLDQDKDGTGATTWEGTCPGSLHCEAPFPSVASARLRGDGSELFSLAGGGKMEATGGMQAAKTLIWAFTFPEQ